METYIKNIHLLPLNDEQREAIERKAHLQIRYARVYFKILEISDEEIIIRVIQEKSPHENHFEAKRLVEIVKETFTPEIVGNRRILVRALPYQKPITDDVNGDFIRQQMNKHKIKGKDLAFAVGIDKNTTYAYINGLKPLTQPVKAAFYYFFKSLEKE